MTQIRDTAAEWLVRINDPDATEAEFAEWQSWLAESPSHREAYELLEQAWAGAARARRIPWPTTDELRADRYSGEEQISTWLRRQQQKGRAARSQRSWRIAAAVLLFFAAATAAWFIRSSNGHVIETTTAEQRSFRLQDGSHVELAAESRLQFDFDPDVRALRLEQGEAYFDVAHDAARPFIVAVGRHQVRAVGTAFNIEKAADRTVITVTQGAVQLSERGSARNEQTSVDLHAGEEVTVDRRGIHRSRPAADARAATSWRQGRLEYLQEELGYVLEDVNRYTDRKLIVTDPQLAHLEFTGTVFLDHLDEWLVTLPGTFPVRVIERGDERLLVRDPGRIIQADQ